MRTSHGLISTGYEPLLGGGMSPKRSLFPPGYDPRLSDFSTGSDPAPVLLLFFVYSSEYIGLLPLAAAIRLIGHLLDQPAYRVSEYTIYQSLLGECPEFPSPWSHGLSTVSSSPGIVTCTAWLYSDLTLHCFENPGWLTAQLPETKSNGL